MTDSGSTKRRAPPIAEAAAVGGCRRSAVRRAHFGRTFDCAFAPWEDDEDASVDVLLTCGEDETARVYAINRDGSREVEVRGVCRGHSGEVVRIGFSRRVGVFATASADGSCKVWDLEAATEENARAVREVASFEGHPGEVYGCCFLEDASKPDKWGRYIATCSETEIWKWDTQEKVVVEKTPTRNSLCTSPSTPDRWRPGYFFSMSRSVNGLLACGCSDGKVRVYSDGTGEIAFGVLLAELCCHPANIVTSTCFLDESRVLCSTGSDGRIVLTEVETWDCLRAINAGSGGLMSTCPVGMGSWIAMVGRKGVVRLMDAFCLPTADAQSSSCEILPENGEEPLSLLCVAANSRGTCLAWAGVPKESETPILAFAMKKPNASDILLCSLP